MLGGGRPRRVGLVVAGLVALVVAAVVVVISDPGRRCRGVELRGGAPVDVEVGDRPLGGRGLQELFGGGQVAYCDDFADPFVLVVEGEHFAYSTSSDGLLVPGLTAGNLFRVGDRHDALAGLPGWAARDVTRVSGEGRPESARSRVAATTLDIYGHLWPGDDDRILQEVTAAFAPDAEDRLRTRGASS